MSDLYLLNLREFVALALSENQISLTTQARII